MRRTTSVLLAAVGLLVLVLAGCKGAGEKGCGEGGACTGGSFIANLTTTGGVAVDSYAGKACQCLVGDAATGDWSLGLVDSNGVDAIVVGREVGGRPGLGSAALLASATGHADLALRARLGFSSAIWTCSAGSDGALVASTSSDASVDGSIGVGLLCTLPGGQTTAVRLDATFQAVSGPVTTIP